VIISHLKGEQTIGLYSLDSSGTTRWTVIDNDEDIKDLQEAQYALGQQGIPTYLEASRRGGHLWAFWSRLVSPELGKKILSPYALRYECYPAGDIPDEDGLGLLLRAPLGIHQATGKRYPFVTPDLQPISPGQVRGQIAALSRLVTRVNPAPFETLYVAPRAPVLPQTRRISAANEQLPIGQFLAANDVRSVIAPYVKLSSSGLGRCPWGEQHKHGDRHPSFKVFDSTQKWWCFTERVGGNTFDFLCRYHRLGPGEMLTRLKV